MKQSTKHLIGGFQAMKGAHGRKITLSDHRANIGRMGRKAYRGVAKQIMSIQEDGGILMRSSGRSTGHTHNPNHPHA